MKIIKPFCLALLFIMPFLAKAQNINIPDIYFKQILVSEYDTSGDGEIQPQEALAIRNLRVFSFGIMIGSQIVDVSPMNLTGIETFTNLETLEIAATGTEYVNVSNLTSLRSIKLDGGLGYHNQLTRLKVDGCTGLDTLQLEGENFFLDSLDLSSCTNLHFFQCYTLYRLKSLTLQGCINLKTLRLGMLGCNQYNISGLTSLEEFSFGSDDYPEINWHFSNFANLRKVYINGAWISNLDFSQCFNLDSVTMAWVGFSNERIDISNSPHLKYFDLRAGFLMDSINRLNTLNLKNGSAFDYFFLDSAFHFQYICADDFEVDTFRQYFANMNQYPIISSVCSFSLLPIKVEYFSLNKKENINQLNWKASCTYGNASFVIERSNDGIRFSSIGNINATSIRCQLPFNFTDNNPVAGKNYYRLKITDADGINFYSKTLAVGNSKAGMEIIALADNTIYLNSNKQQTITIKIIAADGKELLNQKQTIAAGNNNINLPLKSTAKGIYTLVIYTNTGETITKRFLEIKN